MHIKVDKVFYEYPENNMGISLEEYRLRIGCFINFAGKNSDIKMDKQRSHCVHKTVLFMLLLGTCVAFALAISVTPVPQGAAWYLTNNGAHTYNGNTSLLCGWLGFAHYFNISSIPSPSVGI